ncbi:hypothetical protein I3900191A7_16100 [Clostridium baratii]|uniref:hypothetical protein n=1 Tax=Clostridium baratii TaxID=1561 RepID=UPI0036F2CEC3
MRDLLKQHGAKELTRMTCRDIKDKRAKKEREVDYYVADAIKRNYKRMNNSRKVLKQW